MIKNQYQKTIKKIETYRHQLLLMATLLVLILPSFSNGVISEILLVLSLSFLFIQSLATVKLRKIIKTMMRYLAVMLVIILGLQPAGVTSVYIDVVRTLLIILFFSFILSSLFRYIAKAKTVSKGVLITAVNAYLFIGIVSATLAYFLYQLFPGSYNLPANITEADLQTFFYFSFITMSTVGFGDITPAIPETQVLAYLTAIAGQLFVAMAIAFLVGKYLTHASSRGLTKSEDEG